LPQDPGAAGKSQVAYHTKMLRGFTVKSELVTGEKALRADPLASQVNISNVRFVKAHWNPTAIDELMKFPFGAHDDIVDAMSDAFRICTDSGLGFY
jgi:predicted phage terminase large subunit-like protein